LGLLFFLSLSGADIKSPKSVFNKFPQIHRRQREQPSAVAVNFTTTAMSHTSEKMWLPWDVPQSQQVHEMLLV
jgi:hypothetical protein